MREVKTYRCEVDLYRNGTIFRDAKNKLYERPAKGVYFVGAKTAKEAKALLQKEIRFGSITVPRYQTPETYPRVGYKQIKKAV